MNDRRLPDRHRQQFGVDPEDDTADLEVVGVPAAGDGDTDDNGGPPSLEWFDARAQGGQREGKTLMRLHSNNQLYLYAGIVRQTGPQVLLAVSHNPPLLVITGATEEQREQAFHVSRDSPTSGGAVSCRAVIRELLDSGFELRTTYDAQWNEDQQWWEVRPA